MRTRILLLAVAMAVPLGPLAAAEVEKAGLVPAIFGDHMVLQRQMEVPVWGLTAPGGSVTVQFMNQTKTATADAAGRWRVTLDRMEAVKEPQQLTVKDATATRVFKDVLVGEVWLCSGQSNMEMPVKWAANFAQESAAATDGRIRHFKVRFRPLSAPERRMDGPFRPDPITKAVTGQWLPCSPRTVGQFTACGYFMARVLRKELDVPIGLIDASYGGTPIEAWTPPAAVTERDATAPPGGQATDRPPPKEQAAALYNGMIHPLVGYGIRGLAWYQGEANRRDGMRYVQKMKTMVDRWRGLWGAGEFPIHFVQIAPLGNKPSEPSDILPRFWAAQAAAAATIPHASMAVINDISDPKEIHPTTKQEVGRRLALLALHHTYGRKDVECSGPVFKQATPEGHKIRVTFDHAAGLKSRDGGPLTWFEVRGDSTGWAKAEATSDGPTVVVAAAEVDRPVAVRFAWSKVAEPNLSNGAGLPTAAFNTSPDATAPPPKK